MTNAERKIAKLGLAMRSQAKLLYFKHKNNPKIIKHLINGHWVYQQIFLKGAIR